MAKKTIIEVIEELKQNIISLGGTLVYDRQHGKAGVTKDNEQEELKRLRNNLASQLSRLKKRQINQDMEKAVKQNNLEDENGITEKDERRFKNCFCFEAIKPELEYVQRMTGLTIDQIRILEMKYNLQTTRTM